MRRPKSTKGIAVSRKRKIVNKAYSPKASHSVFAPTHQNPVNTGPGNFIGWTARAFEKEEKPESEIPPTMKSCQVNLNGFEGCYCAKCNEFYPYAEPNMDDGTLVCYSCRNPWPN